MTIRQQVLYGVLPEDHVHGSRDTTAAQRWPIIKYKSYTVTTRHVTYETRPICQQYCRVPDAPSSALLLATEEVLGRLPRLGPSRWAF
jgi:hypothetical protein